MKNYKKPGDLFHSDFLDGRSAFFDITVGKSLLPRFIAITAIHPGQAADAGEREKNLKHDDDVLQDGSQFFPLAVDSLGLYSSQSLETLKVIAKRVAYHRKITTSQSVCQLHEQLSVCLWKFNARLVLDRLCLDCNDLTALSFISLNIYV